MHLIPDMLSKQKIMAYPMGNFTVGSVCNWTPAQIDVVSTFLNTSDDFWKFIASTIDSNGTDKLASFPIPSSLLSSLGFPNLDSADTCLFNYRGERILHVVQGQVRRLLERVWDDLTKASTTVKFADYYYQRHRPAKLGTASGGKEEELEARPHHDPVKLTKSGVSLVSGLEILHMAGQEGKHEDWVDFYGEEKKRESSHAACLRELLEREIETARLQEEALDADVQACLEALEVLSLGMKGRGNEEKAL